MPVGVVQVMLVEDATFGAVQVAPPMVTVDAPVTKLVPVMVTDVPPAAEPLVGEIAVTVGAAANVVTSTLVALAIIFGVLSWATT